MNPLAMFEIVTATAWSVLAAVMPLVVMFLVFQIMFLKLPLAEVTRILHGTLVAAAGLLLFLLGVGIAFLPFGKLVGQAVGALPSIGAGVAIGVVLGFVTAWSEPGVRILANEVEEASGGSIHRSIVLMAICIGVAASVGVGLLRVSYGIPLGYILLPGYAIALALMWWGDRGFAAIAADAGGVAAGPLANSFLLALALGAAAAVEGHDPLVDGFGLVALIGLAPVLSVMTVGVLIRARAASGRTSP
jgi:hypothetical protein